jgi:hypothetical protein
VGDNRSILHHLSVLDRGEGCVNFKIAYYEREFTSMRVIMSSLNVTLRIVSNSETVLIVLMYDIGSLSVY